MLENEERFIYGPLITNIYSGIATFGRTELILVWRFGASQPKGELDKWFDAAFDNDGNNGRKKIQNSREKAARAKEIWIY